MFHCPRYKLTFISRLIRITLNSFISIIKHLCLLCELSDWRLLNFLIYYKKGSMFLYKIVLYVKHVQFINISFDTKVAKENTSVFSLKIKYIVPTQLLFLSVQFQTYNLFGYARGIIRIFFLELLRKAQASKASSYYKKINSCVIKGNWFSFPFLVSYLRISVPTLPLLHFIGDIILYEITL